MAAESLASARKQNEALEKSLQSLRGKLSGFRETNLDPRWPSHERGLRKELENLSDPRRGGESPHKRPSALKLKTSLNSGRGAAHDFEPKKTSLQMEKDFHGTNRTRSRRGHVRFQNFTGNEGNYFDDFRNKVHIIRDQKQEAKANLPVLSPNGFVQIPASSQRLTSDEHGQAKQFLVSKIDMQRKRIEDLEAEVQALKLHNTSLLKSQNELQAELNLSDLERKALERQYGRVAIDMAAATDSKSARNENKLQSANSGKFVPHFPLSSSADQSRAGEESMRENAELKRRLAEIAERAELLGILHQRRVEFLENKVNATMSVAKYFCDIVGSEWSAEVEDSTVDILFGPKDNTTLNLLNEVSKPRKNNAKARSLRSYFLVVLFAVRLRRDVESHHSWQPYDDFALRVD